MDPWHGDTAATTRRDEKYIILINCITVHRDIIRYPPVNMSAVIFVVMFEGANRVMHPEPMSATKYLIMIKLCVSALAWLPDHSIVPMESPDYKVVVRTRVTSKEQKHENRGKDVQRNGNDYS